MEKNVADLKRHVMDGIESEENQLDIGLLIMADDWNVSDAFDDAYFPVIKLIGSPRRRPWVARR